MLKTEKTQYSFFCLYALISLIQLYAATKNQLFGDEAFYWLEGQWLGWSYSEVPGWTPWTLALADWLLPNHHFFLRIPNLLAALSLPWVAMLMAKQIGANEQIKWLTGLLMLALPLLGIAGGMAIPDVWIIFFTLLGMLMLARAITTNQLRYFIFLGIVLALGVNVHLRFWIIVLITCVVFMWQCRHQPQVNKRLFSVTMPLMLLGFLPILAFNIQHDFPLLAFQLQDRHPWQFQASHFSFFVVQILITTPLVFWLCLNSLRTQVADTKQQIIVNGVAYTAALHWLMYALVGFFSDALRLNLHWTLVSYVLLLVVAANTTRIGVRLKQAAWLTGAIFNVGLMLTMQYWLHEQQPVSAINARITSNSTGWQELAVKTDALLSNKPHKELVVDHFMTLAQLQFYATAPTTMKVLPHPLNSKHGRAKQLELMDLMHVETNKPELLLVEQTALKLEEQIAYYQMLCEYFNGIELVDSLDFKNGLKNHHYFLTQSEGCQMPPIVYSDSSPTHVSGWVLENKAYPVQLTGVNSRTASISSEALETTRTPLGNSEIFKGLAAKQYNLINFKFKRDANQQDMQLTMRWLNRSWLSQEIQL